MLNSNESDLKFTANQNIGMCFLSFGCGDDGRRVTMYVVTSVCVHSHGSFSKCLKYPEEPNNHTDRTVVP